MSHKVNVGDHIEFVGEAQTKANVQGNMSTARVCSVDWFDQRALDTTSDYTSTTGGAGATNALTAGGEPGVKFTTSTADDAIQFLGTGLIFDITQKPVIETRLKLADVSQTCIFFGFSDAVSETTPSSTIDAADGTLAAVATDAVGFVCDADLGTSSLWCASANAGAAVQSVDTGIDWADAESKTLRVELDTSGNAKFFVDGVQKGYIAAAVADVALCAIFNAGTRAAGSAEVVTARYLKKWQDIP